MTLWITACIGQCGEGMKEAEDPGALEGIGVLHPGRWEPCKLASQLVIQTRCKQVDRQSPESVADFKKDVLMELSFSIVHLTSA